MGRATRRPLDRIQVRISVCWDVRNLCAVESGPESVCQFTVPMHGKTDEFTSAREQTDLESTVVQMSEPLNLPPSELVMRDGGRVRVVPPGMNWRDIEGEPLAQASVRQKVYQFRDVTHILAINVASHYQPNPYFGAVADRTQVREDFVKRGEPPLRSTPSVVAGRRPVKRNLGLADQVEFFQFGGDCCREQEAVGDDFRGIRCAMPSGQRA